MMMMGLYFLVMIVGMARSHVTLDQEEKTIPPWPSVNQTQDKHIDELWNKLGSDFKDSLGNVKTLAKGLLENAGEYAFNRFFEPAITLERLFHMHFTKLYAEVPADALHRFVVGMLKTLRDRNREYCGDVELKYFPLHPGLHRQKRSASKATFHKFGKAIMNVFSGLDQNGSNFIKASTPFLCDLLQQWLDYVVYQAEEEYTPERLKEQLCGSYCW